MAGSSAAALNIHSIGCRSRHIRKDRISVLAIQQPQRHQCAVDGRSSRRPRCWRRPPIAEGHPDDLDRTGLALQLVRRPLLIIAKLRRQKPGTKVPGFSLCRAVARTDELLGLPARHRLAKWGAWGFTGSGRFRGRLIRTRCAGTAFADPKGLPGWRKTGRACGWVRAAGRCARQSLRQNHGLTRKPACPGPTRTIPIRRSVAGRLSALRFCIPWSRMDLGSGRATSTTSTTAILIRDICSSSTRERSGSKAAPSAFAAARV